MDRLTKEFKVVDVVHISSESCRLELESDELALKVLDWVHRELVSKGTGRAFIHKDEISISIRAALRKNGVKIPEAQAPGAPVPVQAAQEASGQGLPQNEGEGRPVGSSSIQNPQDASKMLMGVPGQQFPPFMAPFGGNQSRYVSKK